MRAAASSLRPNGARERRFSTAPFCVAVPRNGRDPLVLDFATSVVAEGKVPVAAKGGKPVPDDAPIDAWNAILAAVRATGMAPERIDALLANGPAGG